MPTSCGIGWLERSSGRTRTTRATDFARLKRIHVDVSYTVRRKPISSRSVRDIVIATLKAERVGDALISVAFVGSAMMARLNKQFLSRDSRTDVISFGLRTSKASPV